MDGKIALEEHWALEETLSVSGQPVGASAWWDELRRLLFEFRDERLAHMDASGIEVAVLGLTSPALQGVLDPAAAAETARIANDTLAAEIAAAPDRFAGFAGLPMQDPGAAAQELTRCVNDLGFKGAMVNCFTQRGVADSAISYDLPEFRPFWGTVADLGVPLYLHPRLTIPSRAAAYEGHRWLYSPVWDFGSETATQALRLIGSGLFDEFPGLQIVLGHLGERIPYDMWRIDNLMSKMPLSYPATKRVSDYMRENVYLTTSGQFDDVAFRCALAAVGAGRLMFSVDYPYEEMEHAARWFDGTELTDADRMRIGRTNAVELLKLGLE